MSLQTIHAIIDPLLQQNIVFWEVNIIFIVAIAFCYAKLFRFMQARKQKRKEQQPTQTTPQTNQCPECFMQLPNHLPLCSFNTNQTPTMQPKRTPCPECGSGGSRHYATCSKAKKPNGGKQ